MTVNNRNNLSEKVTTDTDIPNPEQEFFKNALLIRAVCLIFNLITNKI